ncbi:hypothetical protein VTK73DRAFT_9491 [Phialemonium thermophilum]|uniref:Yeast cell wall synthesis Kre9/Knh1-like N-terminal domain-containing protein n=1 Tax=Phialemonium thermophilum TaxID=223376 RepID=A0ABR3Y529_9PEZI
MKFFTAAAVAFLAAVAQAKVAFTNSAFDVEAGKPITLTWAGNSGPVTITLKNGPADNLKTVTVIDTNDSGNSFTWIPSASLPSDVYALEISDGSDVNYSKQFTFQGSGTASVTAPSATTGSATVSSASASASASASSSAGSSSAVSSTATVISSASSNSTTTSSSHSTSHTSATKTTKSTAAATTSEAPATTVPNTNDSPRYKSPLALVLVTVAALLYFN